MDKIWDRKSFEVGGHCGGDDKNRMTTQNRQKSNAKLKNNNIKTSLVSPAHSQNSISHQSCYHSLEQIIFFN